MQRRVGSGAARRFATAAGRVRDAIGEKGEALRIVRDFVETTPFDLVLPERMRAPILVDSPHSGDAYPAEFLAMSRLDQRAIRRSEDAFVDRLCLPPAGEGLATLAARFPRAYVDVNREAYELDARMFVGRLPPGANTTSARVAGGLGTIPRIVSERDEIYGGPIPIGEAIARIETLYRPFHAALAGALAAIHGRFGMAVLIDCHSMPTATKAAGQEARADVVLGDRNGTSCDPGLTDLVSAALRSAGYRVARNKPYAGGFITEHYGWPARGVHALQIEIARGLYMNESRMEPTGGFETFRADFLRLLRDLADGWRGVFGIEPLAAE